MVGGGPVGCFVVGWTDVTPSCESVFLRHVPARARIFDLAGIMMELS
jgi:hypothetical protein